MKYNEFKHRIYGVIKKYGFKKENKEYVYRNDEMMIIFGLDKSSYGNYIAKYGLGINPKDILEHWNLEEPSYFDICQITVSFWDLMNIKEIKLDNITQDELNDIIQKLEGFLENEFNNYLTNDSLKKMIIENKLKVYNYINEFWNINEGSISEYKK